MSEQSRPRLFVLRVLVLSLLVTLFGRLWYLQVMTGPRFAQAASSTSTRVVSVPAQRGMILDTQGRPLARNRTALVVSVDRLGLARQPDGGAGVLHRLSTVLQMPYAELAARVRLCGAGVPHPCWNGSPYQPIPVSGTVSAAQALTILEQHEQFAGVSAEAHPVREYPLPLGANAAHLLGYLGPISTTELGALSADAQAAHRDDLVGRNGLEAQYQQALAGRPGERVVTVDYQGAVTGTAREVAPRPGANLVTSLDAGVQRALEQALASGLDNARHTPNGRSADYAAGVVLDARTGHVVALASAPSYDPNVWTGGISAADYARLLHAPAQPLNDKAYGSQNPPGSTFKLISTAGAVQEGTASFSGRYSCPGGLMVGNVIKHNFEGEALGVLDLHTTLVKSCDTVFYGFAIRDWVSDQSLISHGKPPRERVQKMARAFGLGARTGVDLPNEAGGLIEDRAQRLSYWNSFLRANACAGAKNPKFDAYRRAIDADNCVDGWKWRLGDQANFDIGQGTVLASPLQMAAAYAALVNGGVVYSPRVGRYLADDTGRVLQRIVPPVRDRLPVPAAVLGDIRSAMYDVPKWGTAAGAFAGFPLDRVAVGGKTGTAEQQPGQPDIAWFDSFAGLPGQPAQYVSVIEIHNGGQGGVVAAPATRQLWSAVYGIGRPALLPGGRLPTAVPAISALAPGGGRR